MTKNLAERLAEEIARCSQILARTAALDGMPQVNVKPMLFMLDRSIAAATRAAGCDDALLQMAALQDLEGYCE